MTRRRWPWFVAGGIVVAAVAAAGAGWLLTRPENPEDVAQAYLEALAAGDGDRALTYLDAPGGDVDLAGALAGASETITEPEVYASGQPAGTDRAGVAVRFTLAGTDYETTMSLRPEGRSWRVLDATLMGVTVSTDLGDAVRLGDTVVAPGTYAVFPGVYPLRAEPAALLTGEAEVAATPDAVTPVVVDAELTAEANAAAQEQIDAYAATCAAGGATVPAACGMRIPWAADFTAMTAVAFRIERTPQLALSPDGASFAATGGDVVATVTGTPRDGATTSVTYRDAAWTLRGSIRFEGEEMILAVD